MKYHPIATHSKERQLEILTDICNAIYIARNITLNNDYLIEKLKDIDSLFKTVEYSEYD